MKLHPASWLVLIVLAWTGPTCSSFAEEDRSAKVRSLIQQLSGSSRSQRQQAKQRLIEIGPEGLSHLPSPDLVPQASVRVLLAEIRTELELKAAEESLRIKPVTVVADDSKTWLNALTTQSGNTGRVELSDDFQPNLPIRRQASSFWSVIDKSGGTPVFDSERGVVRVCSHATDDPPADTSSVFRVAAKAIRREERVLVDLEIWGEPRIRPLYATVVDRQIRLSQGDVESDPLSPDGRREIPMSTRGPVNVTIPLLYSQAGPATLEGEFTVKTATLPSPILFGNLQEPGPVARRRGGVTVVRRTATTDNRSGITVGISVVYDHRGPEFESHRLWIYHNEVWLETTDGTRLSTQPDMEALEEANGGLALRYHFAGVKTPLDQVQFVYVVPACILDAKVTFQIPQLPISKPDQSEPTRSN